ncbi:MAG: hypothetical protein EXQ91_02230 [Alphaproteobacteria bacterium]|nr:hypothetical protein [Alphaproteobacteria bacterium]
MLRISLIIFAVVLPLFFYGLYIWWVNLKSKEAAAAGIVWSDAPWTLLISASLVCVIVILIGYGLATGEDPGGKYVPPRIVDGKIVPAEIK